jgi:hypothetical protein
VQACPFGLAKKIISLYVTEKLCLLFLRRDQRVDFSEMDDKDTLCPGRLGWERAMKRSRSTCTTAARSRPGS